MTKLSDIPTLACWHSSTLMQLLFSFDQDVRVEKILIQTIACQPSCNSCSRLTRTWELRKLSHKLSLVNSYQLSCNSCSRLTRSWELRKLPYTFWSRLISYPHLSGHLVAFFIKCLIAQILTCRHCGYGIHERARKWWNYADTWTT